MNSTIQPKLDTLSQPFQGLAGRMLQGFDDQHIPYLVGDAFRDPEKQLTLWAVGRTLRDGGDPQVPSDWSVTGAVVTNAHPAGKKNPHMYRMAIDVYPKDVQTGQIMSYKHPDFWQLIYKMWAIAEALGIDALGHKSNDPNDQVWTGDPCHYQLMGWFNHTGDTQVKEA